MRVTVIMGAPGFAVRTEVKADAEDITDPGAAVSHMLMSAGDQALWQWREALAVSNIDAAEGKDA